MDKNIKIAVMLSAYDKMSAVVNSTVNKVQGKLRGLQNFRNGINDFGNKASIGGGIASAALAATIKAAEESKIAEEKLKQIFRNRGEVNDNAAESALKYASSLQSVIAVEDEEIAAIQAKIAINKSVTDKADMFNRATITAFNIAADGYGDASSNAAKLGKMLEHPVEGINAFAKAGILFSAKEKDKVKALMASGQQLKAQEFLMQKLENKFHNVAEKNAPASAKLKIALGEIGENIGKILLPNVEKFSGYLTGTLVPKFQDFIEKNPTLVKVLGAVAVALTVVGVAAKVLSAIMMVNPIVLIIAAIAAGAYLIISNWEKIKLWFSELWNKVKEYFYSAWEWIKNMFLDYTPHGLIIKHWGAISDFFVGLWDSVKSIFSSVWEGIKTFFLEYTPAGLIYSHWEDIVNWFTQLWERVKSVFTNAWKSIKSVFSFGSDDEINKTAAAYERSINAVNKRTAAAIAYNPSATVTMANGLMPSPMPLQPSAINRNSTVNYAPNVILNGSATPQDAQNFISMTKVDAVKIMKEAQQKQMRVAY